MAVPHTFTNGTVANATEVNANFVAVAPADLATRSVLDVGVSAQTRAGRALAVTDFTTLLGLGTPVGLYNLGSITNLGSGGALVNKGTVTFAKGVTGTASEAAQFTGSTAQALYTADTGASDPFRLKTGSWGCWFRTAKRGAGQALITKYNAAATDRGWYSVVTASNVISAEVQSAATTQLAIVTGVTDVADDRWHFMVFTFDGSVLRLYVDGALEASVAGAGTSYAGAGALNIGGYGGDAGTATANPFFGRIDEAFVTADVLTEEQIRLLMAVKIPHTATFTPREARVTVRRRKKGGPFVVGDFSATPKVLYNFTAGALTDAGSLGTTLTNNGTAVAVAGADGQSSGAFNFVAASSQYLSGTATGIPSGTTARTFGAWFKTTDTDGGIFSHTGTGGTDFRAIYINSSTLRTYDGTTVLDAGNVGRDGQWHFCVVVIDNSAVDGLKRKLYLDGRLVAADTNLASTTLGTTPTINIGNAASSYLDGSIDGAFITDYAMAQDEISSLYAKGSAVVGSLIVPSLDEQSADQIVQGMDATNLYVLGDVRKRISGKINSDGTVAEAVGGDFRVVKYTTGGYYLCWPPGTFTTPPVITLGLQEANAEILFGEGGNTAAITTVFFRSAVNTPADKMFYFTAEGRGPINSQHQLDLGVAP